jgi:uroporphyrin-III C-methyltransferase/precorrin-2 dehydrogenase/sirohydrochlorin ferrochelatase/uroporphyrin-III C-methyltransferase
MTAVYLIGAGPGDPELLTLKAYRLIDAAEVILHDSLVDPRILRLARRGAKLIDVGKRCGGRSTAQAQICKLLVEEAQTGAMVVRLKGGDPMIFGRATEEMDALEAAGIDYEIVPGITAATAAAASLRLSLTQRRIARSLHFLTGHGAEGGLPAHDWVSLTKSGGTLVVYMGGQVLGGLATHFIEAGMAPDMPAIAIENASLPTQRTIAGTISTLPHLLSEVQITGPILIMIGAALGDHAALQASVEAYAEALE